MKVLITAAEVKDRAVRGERQILAGRDSIVTPAARDMAREMGVTITYIDEQCLPTAPYCSPVEHKTPNRKSNDLVNTVSRSMGDLPVSPELVERIVKEVLAMLGKKSLSKEPVVEKHESGIRLIRGDTVICEPFSTGNPGDKVYLKDLLPLTDSPNMCAGFITMEKSAFEWELKYDEYDYVIDGELEIVVDGQTYRGRPGDVFFIPRGTRITFSSPGSTKFFYVTYPANWREQV